MMLTVSLVAVTGAITFTGTGGSAGQLLKKNVKSVVGTYLDLGTVRTFSDGQTDKPFVNTYPYPTMTLVTITMEDGSKELIELQQITNQATWNRGTLSDLNTAVAAIIASL